MMFKELEISDINYWLENKFGNFLDNYLKIEWGTIDFLVIFMFSIDMTINVQKEFMDSYSQFLTFPTDNNFIKL